MTQAMVTFVAPLGLDKLEAAQRAIDALGNPASAAVRTALELPAGEQSGTHFASLHAIRSSDGTQAYIIFEFTGDGSEDDATARIVGALGPMLKPVFMLSSDWKAGSDAGSFLKAHKLGVGNGLFGNPGLCFAGTPGLTVGRIDFENRVARACADLVERQGKGASALDRIAQVRAGISANAALRSALDPATATPPFEEGNLVGLVTGGIAEFISTYLWPFIAVVLLAAVLAGLYAAQGAPSFWPWLGAFAWSFLLAAWQVGWLVLAGLALLAVLLYLRLRKAEATDSLEPHSPPQAVNRAMFERENQCAQNHMLSVTRRKPGRLRWFTSRLVFFVIGLAAGRYYRPGFLSDIGTIHFARWVTVPWTRDVLFLSNYGGSWESYLEDFITKAHAGLTGVWSNTIGFPRTENLFQLGATDGDRFKRFARHSMVPTRFWYSAYPEITTATIRSNTLIRSGLSGVMTEDEALNWLALFGSSARPAAKLVSSDIQSLIFGGLGFLPFGTCFICQLPEDKAKANAWLKAIRADIAFNDGRRLAREAVITLSLSWRGLTRLGLPAYAGPTFPFAFVEGMTSDYRRRILGDRDKNSPDNWLWGKEPPDAAILVYGRSEEDVAVLTQRFLEACSDAGMPDPREIPLKAITQDKREPFGFVDGVSQPVIRGTYKSLRNADPIHIVEPGEMVLGYPDNRGYIPPTPTLLPNSDPGNKLPLLGALNDFSCSVADAIRDVGFNGSFLVIRQLEQDVGGFKAYCEGQAALLKQRLPPPYHVIPEYIGAKLVGRWHDGSSLVRQPYESATDHREKLEDRAARQAALSVAVDLPLVVESTDVNATSRPKSNPQAGTPIDPTSKQPEKPVIALAAAADVPHRRPVRPDNDFLFGAEDPEGMRCPYGAHIRRANPRDSLDPGNADQISISNRHRIARVGRQYKPEEGQDPGLLFMCLCADIERQFEFLQQTWLQSASFHGLDCERDPLLGDGAADACGYTVPSPTGPIGLDALPSFVTTRGGGYFFLPGRRLIDYLIEPL